MSAFDFRQGGRRRGPRPRPAARATGRCPPGRPLAALAGVALTPLLGQRPLARLDRVLLAAVVAQRRPTWASPARWLTDLAAQPMVSGAVAGTAAWATYRGASARTVLRIVTAAAAGIALRRGLAETIRRPRPPAAWWWEHPSGFSYPSRHVVWAALGYGAVADLLHVADLPAAVDAVRNGAVTVVATTRVVLAVHWPSDVAAAIAFAAAWRHLSWGGGPVGGEAVSGTVVGAGGAVRTSRSGGSWLRSWSCRPRVWSRGC